MNLLGFNIIELMDEENKSTIANLNAKQRNSFFMISQETAIDQLKSKIETIGSAIQVVFPMDARCTACGVIGDRRLLPNFCHLIPIFIHPKKIQAYHSGSIILYHPSQKERYHSGKLTEKTVWHGHLWTKIMSEKTWEYSCCYKKPHESQGCRQRYHYSEVLKFKTYFARHFKPYL